MVVCAHGYVVKGGVCKGMGYGVWGIGWCVQGYGVWGEGDNTLFTIFQGQNEPPNTAVVSHGRCTDRHHSQQRYTMFSSQHGTVGKDR